MACQNPELITIDLDGTLVDSVGDLHEAVARMQRALSLPESTEAQVRHWVGNGVEKLVHRALSADMELAAQPGIFEPALILFGQAYDEVNGTRSTLYPGVLEGLEWMKSLEIPLVMVTNKAARFAYPLLDNLGISSYFSYCVAGDEVSEKKPAPAALLKAARHCAVKPQKSVMIGDSISDIRAARAAGFSVISVSYGYNHGQSVRQLVGLDKPDFIVDSFSELPQFMLNS